jgi:hypothetical protein
LQVVVAIEMSIQIVLAALQKVQPAHKAVVARRLRIVRDKNIIRRHWDILIENLFRNRTDAALANDIARDAGTACNIQERLIRDRIIRISDRGRPRENRPTKRRES